MMSPHLHKLVEAVRNLNIEVVSRDGEELVRIPGGAKKLPDGLIALQRALEQFDNSEASGDVDSYSYLLVATQALVTKAKKKGDRRNTYNIVNDAISKYGDQAWAGGSAKAVSKILDGNGGSDKMETALASSEGFRVKSLEKAKADIKKREEEGPTEEDDDTSDMAGPAHR